MGLFKSYDIRGIYGKDLRDDFAYLLGKAIIKFTNAKVVVIGYDSRISSLKLFYALTKSLTEQGVNVIHVGLVSRPMLNWVCFTKKYELGIMITASHNPRQYNGFKFIFKGKPLSYNNGLNKVEKIIAELKGCFGNKNFKDKFNKKIDKKGTIISKDFIDEYVQFLSSKLCSQFIKKSNNPSIKPLKIVADASNGSAGEIIRKFMKLNNIDCEILFLNPDGNFPCHDPNPLNDSSLRVLSKNVIKNKADFGFIVDPDADRIRTVDEKGNIIDNYFLAALIVKNILSSHNKNCSIVHDLIAKRIVIETIRRYKDNPVISKVGFVNISENMRHHKALFGCEGSGHFYFKEFNYMDSAMMMLVHMINMLYSNNNFQHKISKLIKPLDKYYESGELNYNVDDASKAVLIQRVRDYFSSDKKQLRVQKILDLDGVSVYLKDSWFNIRPSNTEPLLRLRIESVNSMQVKHLKKLIERLLLSKL